MSERCQYCGWVEESGYAHDCRAVLHKEIERLQAIVDRLPKTADGVPVVPYVSVVWANPMYFGHVIPKHVNDDGAIWLCGNGGPPVSQCYSTPEAAEAARTEVGE